MALASRLTRSPGAGIELFPRILAYPGGVSTRWHRVGGERLLPQPAGTRVRSLRVLAR